MRAPGIGVGGSVEVHLNLPPSGVTAAEIVSDLEAALEQFRTIEEDLVP